MKRLKILVLGEIGVGKSSLIDRLVHGTFGEVYLTTLGVRVESQVFRFDFLAEEIEILLWEIAGDLQDPELLKKYSLGAHGALLVADVSRQGSLTKALYLESQLIKHKKDVSFPCLLLLNKWDLMESGLLSLQELRNTLASLGHVFFTTSAKTGAGVEKSLRMIAMLALGIKESVPHGHLPTKEPQPLL
jgi:small GTP-binding protein